MHLTWLLYCDDWIETTVIFDLFDRTVKMQDFLKQNDIKNAK